MAKASKRWRPWGSYLRVQHLTLGRAGLGTQVSSSEDAFSIMPQRRPWAEGPFQVLSLSFDLSLYPYIPKRDLPPPSPGRRQVGGPAQWWLPFRGICWGLSGTSDHPVPQVMQSESSRHLAGPGESNVFAVKVDCGIRLPGPSTLLSHLKTMGP